MLIPHLTKLLAFIWLIVTVTAFPAPRSSINTAAVAQCQPACQSMYASCLGRNPNVDFCRAFVCDHYDDKCTSCIFDVTQTHSVPPKPPSPVPGIKRIAFKKAKAPAKNVCIVVCAHVTCGLLCSNPPSSGSSSTLASTTADDLVATTNSQPGEIGIPLSPGANTVVLGQKEKDGQTNKCAWFCSASTSSCAEECWAADDVKGAIVMDGGYLGVGETVGEGTECQVMDKDDVGRFIVCASTVPVEEMEGVRCTLVWEDDTPYLGC